MLFCNFCTGSPKVAVVGCENCSYFYCSACHKKFHPKVGPFRTHNIVKASVLNSERTFCPIHIEEKCCIFCENCKQLLCLKCVPGHAAHDLINTEQAFKSAKDRLQGLADRIDNHLSKAQAVKQDSEEQILLLKNELKEAERKIKTEIEFLHNTISGCEKTMISVLHQKVSKIIGELNKSVNDFPKQISGSLKILNELSDINKQSSITHVLMTYGDMLQRAESQLEILDTIKQPYYNNRSGFPFNYEDFNCMDEVNMLASRLTIFTSEPDDYGFDIVACRSNLDCHKHFTSPVNQRNQDAEIDYMRQAKANVDKLVTHTISEGGATRNGGKGYQLRETKSAEQTTFRLDDNLSMGLDGYECSPYTAAKESNVASLEAMLQRSFEEECDTLTEQLKLAVRSLPSEERIGSSSVGVKQRAREGYYSSYKLSSDKVQEEMTQTSDTTLSVISNVTTVKENNISEISDQGTPNSDPNFLVQTKQNIFELIRPDPQCLVQFNMD